MTACKSSLLALFLLGAICMHSLNAAYAQSPAETEAARAREEDARQRARQQMEEARQRVLRQQEVEEEERKIPDHARMKAERKARAEAERKMREAASRRAAQSKDSSPSGSVASPTK